MALAESDWSTIRNQRRVKVYLDSVEVTNETNKTITYKLSGHIYSDYSSGYGVGLRLSTENENYYGTDATWVTQAQANGCYGSHTVTLTKGSSAVTKGVYAILLCIEVNGYGAWSGPSVMAKSYITVPAATPDVVTPNAPSDVTATFAPGSDTKTDRFYVSWKTNPPSHGGIANNIIMYQANDGEWAECGQVSGDTTSFEFDTIQYPTNGKYRFKVASKNSAGTSSYTESPVRYTTPTKPDLVFGSWRPKQDIGDYSEGNPSGADQLTNMVNVTCSSGVSPYYIGTVTWKLGVAIRHKTATSNLIEMGEVGGETGSSISLDAENLSLLPISYVKDADQLVTFYAQCSVTTPDGLQTSEMTEMVKLSIMPQIYIRSDVTIKNLFINAENAIRGVYFRTS